MLRLPLDNIRPGMVTAQGILDAAGQQLVEQDTLLDYDLIKLLNQNNIYSIYIRDSGLATLESTKSEALHIIKQSLLDLGKTQPPALETFPEAISKYTVNVLDEPAVLTHLTTIRLYDFRTFSHSVNVCVLSTLLGLKMNLGFHQIKNLAAGAILHDLGKIAIPLQVLNKKETLTDNEWRLIKDHPHTSFNVLSQQNRFSKTTAATAYQHHENYDGSGYPYGLKGDEIHLFARIVATADLYEAIVTDRSYRSSMTIKQAYQIMAKSKKKKLDPKIVDCFLENAII